CQKRDAQSQDQTQRKGDGYPEVLTQENGTSFYRLCQQQLGKFPGIVIIHDPKDGPDEGDQDDDDIHERNDRIVEVAVEEQQDHAQQQVKKEVDIAPAAAGEVVEAVLEDLQHDIFWYY